MLPVKKMYIDSRWKSHRDFNYEFGSNNYDMPNNTSFYIDDVNIPNSWYSIEHEKNNKLYLRWKDEDNDVIVDDILEFPSKTYDGDEFVKELNELLLTIPVSYFQGNKIVYFNATFDPLKNIVNISSSNCAYFKILSDDELQSPHLFWTGPSEKFRTGDLCSLNEVIKNYGDTPVYNYITEYQSGFLDFSHYNNIYMSSTMATYQTLGPMGQDTIIRKIPVNVPHGSVINDRQVSQHDSLDCSRLCLSRVNFRFHDAHNKTVNLNGCHVSFSIVCSSIKEYIFNFYGITTACLRFHMENQKL